MSELVNRARFLAAGQDDPHSATITELCDRAVALEAALAGARHDLIFIYGDLAQRYSGDPEQAWVKEIALRARAAKDDATAALTSEPQKA